VNTGAFDPFDPIIDWARRRNAWVHIDGAFGLWAAASPSRRHLVAGLARADSWATDGHKWLNLPYDSGILLIRDASRLRPSMSATASYLPQGELDPLNHTPQSSQRARAIDAWAALRTLGRAGLVDLIDRCCRQRAQPARRQATYSTTWSQPLAMMRTTDRGSHVFKRTASAGAPTLQGRRDGISVSSWAAANADVPKACRNPRRDSLSCLCVVQTITSERKN
jgi:glutamate/tyrosine decarboxylase-like PLP-dependent enzyme